MNNSSENQETDRVARAKKIISKLFKIYFTTGYAGIEIISEMIKFLALADRFEIDEAVFEGIRDDAKKRITEDFKIHNFECDPETKVQIISTMTALVIERADERFFLTFTQAFSSLPN